ncbi:MAG: 4-alpha-glucanotransferase [Chloroflexota bacterium]
MNFPRASGILLHPTSLPGLFGIGNLGNEAYRFADFLENSGQHLWQVLPLGPTGYGDSPYQSLSIFAGNPLLISPAVLVKDKFLELPDQKDIPLFSEQSVDYGSVINIKTSLFRRSFEIFQKKAAITEQKQFTSFCEENALWLEDYSLFMALKEAHHLTAWNTWEEDTRKREPKALNEWRMKLAGGIRFHQYQQFQFFKQWSELKKYCTERSIKLIGDIPIFVAMDSAEVWSHPEMFYLDEAGKPTVVAGVPPDYFSETGQLWGNPIYRWDVMAKDGFKWWIERFRATLKLVDIVRVDHFRGFEKYWEVPAQETTAINGRWVAGPGVELFLAVQKALGELPIIAEDLGVITPDVEALRDRFGFPGMKVLQFAFSTDSKTNKYQPHNYPGNCVVYTGTHDNNTTVGWFKGDDIVDNAQNKEKRRKETRLALDYMGTDGSEINWDFIRLSLMSVADTVIIPLQDVLGLGGEARMNHPSTKEGNWRWRFTSDMLTDEITTRLKKLTKLYER